MNRRVNSLTSLAIVAVLAFVGGYLAGQWNSRRSPGYTSIHRADRRETRDQQVSDLVVSSETEPVAPAGSFIALVNSNSHAEAMQAMAAIQQHWQPGSAAILLECLRFVRSTAVADEALALLQDQTGQRFGRDLHAWYRWIWNQEYVPHPEYAKLKAELYSNFDPRFREYFASADSTSIRLDEVHWGGVRRDGIPPLKDPAMLSAGDADYLADTDVVFGVEINGDARAYPKRILAWHEMVKDTIGGESINGVYCTLCGSMIVYRTNVGGTHHELGTSGFLYRSNKLMYDHATKSLWSTLDGTPVVGALVGHGIKLDPLYVVTTTWGEWRNRHPKTQVLSLQTGYERDYGEGVAYHDYFATDELMFGVPELDSRLLNKDEVLAIRLDDRTEEKLAISVKLLDERRIYHGRLGETGFVVLTDDSGANRVYESKGLQFVELLDAGRVRAKDGSEWDITETALESIGGTETRQRLPSHRAFWFGWYAAFPTTRLVK